MIPPSSTIGTLIKLPSNLDVCLETKVTEVEVIPGVIEPGVSPNIDTGGDVAERRIRAGTKASGPSGTRVRDSGISAERSTQTLRGEVVISAIEGHGGRKK
jgi:hypothetical protein